MTSCAARLDTGLGVLQTATVDHAEAIAMLSAVRLPSRHGSEHEVARFDRDQLPASARSQMDAWVNSRRGRVVGPTREEIDAELRSAVRNRREPILRPTVYEIPAEELTPSEPDPGVDAHVERIPGGWRGTFTTRR